MRKVCDLPYGYELLVDGGDCSPMIRRGRAFMCRPHELTDPGQMRNISSTLMVEEVRARKRGDSLAVSGIVNARGALDENLKARLRDAKEVPI